jgi:sugar/nucleoside kinase (ribokinase family)
VILLVAGQDRRYIHSFGANAAFTVSHIDRDWVRSLKVFYLGGLFLMPAFRPDEFLDLLHFCRSQGVVTVVDVVIPQNTPLPSDLRPLLGAIDYFLPNDDEARLLTGEADPLDQLRCFSAWGANTVLITRGKHGAIVGRGGETWQAGIYPMNQIDPSGSGDAFDAGVITGILRGWEMPQIIRYASALGASAVRALGTTDGVFTAAEAEAFVDSQAFEVRSGKI